MTGPRPPGWSVISGPPGTSSWPSTWRWSAMVARPSWRPPASTRRRCARRTRWPYCPLTRRPRPRSSSGAGRRSASPILASAATSPRRLLRSWPSWPATRPALQPVQRGVDALLRHRARGAERLGEQADPQLFDHPANGLYVRVVAARGGQVAHRLPVGLGHPVHGGHPLGVPDPVPDLVQPLLDGPQVPDQVRQPAGAGRADETGVDEPAELGPDIGKGRLVWMRPRPRPPTVHLVGPGRGP